MTKTVKVTRSSTVIDLSCAGELTRRAIRDWMESGHTLDRKLLLECAYYPRAGCQGCTFQSPNPKCNRSHILKLEPPKYPTFNLSSYKEIAIKKATVKQPKLEAWGRDLTNIWSSLPDNIKAEVMGVIKGSHD